MKALILGCSHAAGAEICKDPVVVDRSTEFERQHSFPALVAQQLGYVPMNCAISGGSNDAMFRIFIEQLPQLTTSDIVIACWTGISRTEVRHAVDSRWLQLIAGTEYHSTCNSLLVEYSNYTKNWTKFGYSDQSAYLNKLKNIQALNVLAQQRSIRVINIDSFWPTNYTDNIPWAHNNTFWDWAVSNNHYRTEYGHFFLATHQAYADFVVNCLTTNTNTVQ